MPPVDTVDVSTDEEMNAIDLLTSVDSIATELDR